MKIGLVVTHSEINRKTWSGTVWNLAEALRRAGHDPVFLPCGFPSMLEQKAVNLYLRLRYACRSSITLHSSAGRSYFKKKLLHRLEQTGIPDVMIHIADPLAAIEPEQEPCPQYLYCDSTWSRWNKRFLEGLRDELRLELMSAAKDGIAVMQHIFCTGEYLIDEYVAEYGIDPDCITAVGTGVGVVPDRTCNEPKDYDTKKLLFVSKQSGEHFIRKGGALLLDAFKRVKMRYPDAKLVLLGNETVAREVAGMDGVEAYGFVSVEMLNRIYRESCLFVQPALDEPWGLVYLEALMHRIPIVGLNRNAFPEFCANGQFGFIVPEADPANLATVLERALESPELLEKMGRSGCEFIVSKYTWDKVAERIVRELPDSKV